MLAWLFEHATFAPLWGFMKKLYLVDVSSMFFRAFYAVRMLTNSKGLPTNAIYGFLSMSVKLLKDVKPDYMVYCFDQPGPSFRKEIYEGYKANRSETPEELLPQIPYVQQLTDLLGIPSMGKESFEADDVIGSLSRFGVDNNLEVVIVSGDKDFAQLISRQVHMLDTMKDKLYDPDTVMEKWGVKPEQFIDYLAMTGDSSDNIPGIKGVGPKGAQNLLSKYNTLDSVYENIERISAPAMRKKLTESKENAYLSQRLVKIVTDLDLVKDLKDLSLRPINRQELGQLLDELEFGSFKKKLIGNGVETNTVSEADEVKVDSLTIKSADLNELDQELADFDTILAWRDPRQFFIIKELTCLLYDGDLKELGERLAQKKLKWRGFDIKSLWRDLGISQGDVVADLMLSAYLLKAGPVKDLGELYQEQLGKTLPEFPQAQDIYNAFQQVESRIQQQLKDQKMLPILQTVDLPLVEVLSTMEAKGVLLDKETLSRQSQEIGEHIEELELMIKAQAEEEFNVASPKQLSVILFEKLGLPKGKKTKTGYSTANDVLEKLLDKHPIINLILDYRELTKLKSTYLDTLPELVNPATGRIHTIFNQALTTTGRLSSNHPNLQNIPIRTDKGKRVREAFVVPKGFKMLSADYSQIELRVLAHISQDQGLIDAFQQDRDIHAWTASEIFSVPLDEVTSEQRRMAKAVNFGIAYGQGAYGLAETLGIPRQESKQIITHYFDKFPGVKKYMESIVVTAKEQGYVETLFGRRRYLPELLSKNPMQKSFAERAAINAPIQGTASDLVKMAMLELFEDFSDSMLIQVHDELLFEVPEKEIETSAAKVKQVMEENIKLNVPLKVNVSWGDNWSEAH
jgi:DNA polymerase I